MMSKVSGVLAGIECAAGFRPQLFTSRITNVVFANIELKIL
jgi:hypothetical protein